MNALTGEALRARAWESSAPQPAFSYMGALGRSAYSVIEAFPELDGVLPEAEE